MNAANQLNGGVDMPTCMDCGANREEEEHHCKGPFQLHPLVLRSVFAFEFCFCRFTSGFSVQSLHSTKAGAYRAMMKHKHNHWYDERNFRIVDASEIGWAELWQIKKYELTD